MFSETERAGLLDDALMLARVGDLDYNTALNVTLYMVNEDEYIPWSTLVDNMDFLWTR